MKSLLLLACLAFAGTGRATMFYSGVQNIPIPVTQDGVYLRMSDGVTNTTFPANWSTEPWLNPFFGGVDIANSPLLRPIITGTDQILNLAPGTIIGSTSNFVAGESGSSTHVGNGPGQFTLGTPGIIGFAFDMSVGGPDLYGWLRIDINNTSPGTIVDWAYQTTPGASIIATQTPEPCPMILAGAGFAVSIAFLRRRVVRQ